MRVAVIHFHLRRGGVTHVIETAAESLRESEVEFLVLGGDAPATLELPSNQVRVIPGLGYRDEFNLLAARKLKADLEAAAREQWGELPDIWHVHNHGLAKNLEVPWVVSRWAEEGQRILLQPHDFAEDGRPKNHRKLQEADGLIGQLYPVGATVLYGLLNSRDRRLLNAAGIPASQTVPLPNAVRGFDRTDKSIDLAQFAAERLILYPSRSIRRKNLGEVLLHAAVVAAGTKFGCTLAPENPTALPIYRRWTEFAAENSLPVEFNVGPRTGASLESMMSASEAILSTSVAEGFGLAFLEPWLAGCPLVGRNLEEITADFTGEGVDLGALYDTLPIPIEWIGRENLRATVKGALGDFYHAYGRDLDADASDVMSSGEVVDFGRLNESLQEQVIGRVLADSGAADHLREMDLLRIDAAAIAKNRAAVSKGFGVAEYGLRLTGYYERLMSAGEAKCEWLDPDRLLDEFLSPERFCLLRT